MTLPYSNPVAAVVSVAYSTVADYTLSGWAIRITGFQSGHIRAQDIRN
jgi:hypothetical protein